MVLSLMRKHAKSWLIKFLIGIIAIVFIFYFGYSFKSRSVVKIATVNGEVITGVEYDKAYRDLVEGLRRQYRDAWNDNLIKTLNLKTRALEGLIEQKLISSEAKRLGLAVTKSEIQKAIMKYPAFQVNGAFDMGLYRSLLRQNRMKPEDFENAISGDLLRQKVREFLWAFAPVTDQEVLDAYSYINQKVKISFVRFDPEKFKKDIKIDEKDLENFFNEHKEEFRIPAKIKVSYILLDPKDFKSEVKVTDEEVKEYYEENMDSYKEPKKVRARHILFRLKPNATEKEEKKVKEKAEKVLKMAREGKDFAELAKKYSEGPTKSTGGDLGYFSKGKMVKPFEEAAFKLKKGEVSDLVRTQFGYHIIKVEDIKEARTKPLEEVKDKIRDLLVNNACKDLANEKGLSLIDQMPYDVNLEKYAKDHGLEAHETGLFSMNEPIPGIGGTRKLRESLFALEKGETTDVIELGGKFYIFQVSDREASHLPELKDVRDKVKERFIASKAAEKAKEEAEKFLKMVKTGKEWKALAQEKGLKIEETDYFTRVGSIPKIGYEPELREMAFSLGEGRPYPDKVYEARNGAYVIRWEGKKDIDKEKFEKEKKQYRFSVFQRKQNQLFQKWLEALKQKAEIKIITPIE